MSLGVIVLSNFNKPKMKNIFFIALAVVGINTVRAQSYLGYFSDNYSGTQGLLYNPSNVVDSPFKIDINLFSGSVFGSNDYYGVKFTDVIKSDYDFEASAKKFPMNSNNAFINVDTQGLSVMFNITPKHSLGLFTRGRAIVNATDINGNTFSELDKDFKGDVDYSINEGNYNMTGNSWAEVGLTYGTILLDKGQHFLKAGLTAKYLQGLANTYSQGKNLSIVYDANAPILGIPTPGNNEVTVSGEVIYGGTNDFEESAKDFDFNSTSRGFAADLGLIYEWRPEDAIKANNANRYKLKFGLSVTDLGSLKFKNDTLKRYVLNKTVNAIELEGKDYEEILAMFATLAPTQEKSVKSVLPTALHANIDWNIYNKFYLNLNGDIGLTAKDGLNTNFNPTTVTFTPRYESKWIGVFLPVNYSEYRDFQAGFGFRAGPLFLGSGSIITNLFNDDSKGADIYAGLRVPIYGGKRVPKVNDKDGDGVVDKEDICPDVAGPIDNRGCPYKDSDKDGIIDKEDHCPNEPGEKDNRGCPWVDSDKDGILDKDDKCSDKPGPKENKGCPWPDKDGDTVIDKDDKCPDVKGTVKNNGCPEVTDEVIKKLNDYAKTILFDTSKATFQQQTYPVLQAMVAILKEYPSSKFSIEGHTDSDGKDTLNQKLSEDRAAAVKNYLIENGVDASRLTSVGYGETKPIASNKTKVGKAQNRRVEVKLIK